MTASPAKPSSDSDSKGASKRAKGARPQPAHSSQPGHSNQPEERPAGPAHAPGSGVVLLGYRGSGKSTVGAEVAQRLGRGFLDTDTTIAHRFGGRDAATVFATPALGERAFREVEGVVVTEAVAAAEAGAIVATGGGAVTESPAARAAVRNGRVLRIYLRADADVLGERIAADALNRRPGLSSADADPSAEVAEVLARRDPLYREVADVVIDTGGRSIDEVAVAVMEQMNAKA